MAFGFPYESFPDDPTAYATNESVLALAQRAIEFVDLARTVLDNPAQQPLMNQPPPGLISRETPPVEVSYVPQHHRVGDIGLNIGTYLSLDYQYPDWRGNAYLCLVSGKILTTAAEVAMATTEDARLIGGKREKQTAWARAQFLGNMMSVVGRTGLNEDLLPIKRLDSPILHVNVKKDRLVSQERGIAYDCNNDNHIERYDSVKLPKATARMRNYEVAEWHQHLGRAILAL